MNSNFVKLVQGVLTVGAMLGLVYFTFFYPADISQATESTWQFRDQARNMLLLIGGIFTIAYTLYALFGNSISKERKYLWAALLIISNLFVTPFVWYLEIWKKQKTT